MRGLPDISVVLPDWFEDALPEEGEVFRSLEDRMKVATHLAELNIANKTGGPFGAAVFDEETGTLVSAGVNLVIRSGLSLAHAEMIAIGLAQRVTGTFDLAEPGLPRLQLVTSAEPCVMCFGALTWSGIRSLVCGARDEDVRAIGFDEGAKTADWAGALKSRGITVIRDIGRSEASRILRSYEAAGGPIYNATRGMREELDAGEKTR